MLPDFSAVILDMDGLVIDTEKTYCIAWRQAALSLGYEISEQFFISLSGLHYQSVEQKIREICGAGLQLDDFRRLSGEIWRHHVAQNGIEVKSGFYQLLDVIKQANLKYCLATNSLEFNANECLSIAGIRHFFSIVIARDHVESGKPSPDLFFKAAEQMDTQITRCLVVEDSATGLEAAINAGAFAVLVPSVHPVAPKTAAMADLILNDLAGLAAEIEVKFT